MSDDSMGKNWELQVTINLINDFCADPKTFSYKKLSFLRLKKLTLEVDAEQKILSFIISTQEDYQHLMMYLMPEARLHQLLSLYFKKVGVYFGVQDEPLQNAIYLDTIHLAQPAKVSELREMNIGARLRRTINVAFQGHVGVLQLRDEKDVQLLRKLWSRGRVEQLLEKYDIVPFDDDKGRFVKLWKPHSLEEGENIIIVIS